MINTTTTQKKIITVLGVGGHGSSAYIDLLINPLYKDYDVHIVMGVEDSGGHTGLLQRVMALMTQYGDTSKYPPLGDLRSNLSRLQYYFQGESGDLFSNALENRYDGNDINEFLTNCEKLANLFEIEASDVQKFLKFCQNYFESFLANKEMLLHGKEIQHSIGNLFLTYLYMQSNANQVEFFENLRRLN